MTTVIPLIPLECPRCGGLVVSALDFRSGGRWFEPSLCLHVVSLDKKLYSILSLFTQVYKWVPAIIMLGVTLQRTSIPSRGGVAILLVASCYRNPGLCASLMGLIARMQTLPPPSPPPIPLEPPKRNVHVSNYKINEVVV